MPLDLSNDTLVFSFPEIHADAMLRISFQRTLRVPDDGQEHFLPPGLGNFPVRDTDALGTRAPAAWRKRGGVVLPMWQAETCWISFSSPTGYPMAVKVAAGKINAVNGKGWTDALDYEDQDYMEVPNQPWLDGFCVTKGVVRQFVAMPLGQGYTAEGQLNGSEEFGGIQLLVRPLKGKVWEKRQQMETSRFSDMMWSNDALCASVVSMGLAPGGAIRQQIEVAVERPADWAPSNTQLRCFVHIANSAQWTALTGATPPTKPPTAADYTRAGLPWFDLYSDGGALEGSGPLDSMKTVKTLGADKGQYPLGLDESFVLPIPTFLGVKPSITDKADADW